MTFSNSHPKHALKRGEKKGHYSSNEVQKNDLDWVIRIQRTDVAALGGKNQGRHFSRKRFDRF